LIAFGILIPSIAATAIAVAIIPPRSKYRTIRRRFGRDFC